jgi:hypothetical protein
MVGLEELDRMVEAAARSHPEFEHELDECGSEFRALGVTALYLGRAAGCGMPWVREHLKNEGLADLLALDRRELGAAFAGYVRRGPARRALAEAAAAGEGARCD